MSVLASVTALEVAGQRIPGGTTTVAVVVAAVLALLLATKLARLARMSFVAAGLFVLMAGLIAVVNLAPEDGSSAGVCRTTVTSWGPAETLGDDDRTGRMAMFVPLGALAMAAASSRLRVLLLVGAAGLPVGIEVVKRYATSLARTCDVTGIHDSLLGLGAGAVIGLVIVRFVFR
ncbi:hypothetical protein BH23ACT2_BH23ACT2_15520 [soil metagenome]